MEGNKLIKRIVLLLNLTLCLVYGDRLDESAKIITNSNQQTQVTQRSIEELDDATREMYEEYKDVLSNLESQRNYNNQLREIISSQEGEKKLLVNDIKKIEHTQKNIIPLMHMMMDWLDRLVQVDTPFLVDERTKRVENLKANLKRADLSTSDKFRQVLEAYKIENDYANTIESYQAKLDERVVEFLRVGRVGLYYQTLDFEEVGMYDSINKKFITLDSSYNKQINQAIRISKKQLAPDLLILPLIKDVK